MYVNNNLHIKVKFKKFHCFVRSHIYASVNIFNRDISCFNIVSFGFVIMEKIFVTLAVILLVSVILNTVMAHERSEYTKQINTSTAVLSKMKPDIVQDVIDKKSIKKHKKSKRNAYRRNWSSKLMNYGGYMPPYLVFNRKVGAYYPYYNYPKEQGITRRNMYTKKQSFKS
ncbi:uncharacterized protein LOC113521964 [Galleria mellonella]|uniref:Uncharacterized protein LOC113521964 n=1 Tax=Galleria mellonella TaxID=7137 RepID=A0A6J1X2E6_GALME|nr:uncharacterized protein LOC113521964 [Galleria mellonella]